MSDALPDLRFSHFGFFVRDMTRMEDFYVRVLGLTVTDRGGRGNRTDRPGGADRTRQQCQLRSSGGSLR